LQLHYTIAWIRCQRGLKRQRRALQHGSVENTLVKEIQHETKSPESKVSRDGNVLDDMQLRLGEQEDEEGRTSMDKVTRRSGDDIERSKYRKMIAMATRQAKDNNVLPTLTVTSFQHRLNSTSPSAILRPAHLCQ
jgi:hypothetical protein